MSVAPPLNRDDLQAELGKLFARRSERQDATFPRRLAAIYGRCEPDVLEIDGQPIEVVPVASEYELRLALPDPHEERRLAFVLAYPAIEVPVDIAGRFVKRGRVRRLGRHERLRRLFAGALDEERSRRSLVELEDKLVDSALGRYLLGAPESELLGLAIGTAKITLEQAYARWLHVRWQLPEQLSGDSLLAACASNQRHEVFARATDARQRPEAAGLLDELFAVLRQTNQPELELIVRCWLAGKGHTLLEFAVLFEANAARPEPDETLENALVSVGVGKLERSEAEVELLVKKLPAVVPSALSLFAQQQGNAALRNLLRVTEAHVLDRWRAKLHGSRYLPLAWDLRLEAVGEALIRVAEQPEGDEGQARYSELSRKLIDLEFHDSIALGERRQTYAHAEMARRLAAWLVVRNDRRWPVARGPLGKLEALAGWYAQEGGFVDWARRRVRGLGEGRFGEGVRAVLSKVDELRTQQDREFADALPKWLEAGRPERRVLPIDKVLERFAANLLRGEDGVRRRLMVLVLDGMAWAQAVELLIELGGEQSADPWQPVVFNREVHELDARASFVPVLASLPTMTEFSRSALFSGQATPAGSSPRSTDDDRRFAKHPALAALFTHGDGPTLLGARESFSTDEGLTASARTLIADRSQPVVGFLLNTIDSALKSDRLDDAPWTVERIRPLRALFDAAREAGRAVLLCSDHGHVSGQRLRYSGQAGASSRWRALTGDPVREYEVAIPSPPGWRPDDPQARGVVLIKDDCHAYHGQPHHGEHGGATLAEVVTPAILLGTAELEHGELGADPMLALTPMSPPPWWLDEVREPEGRKAAVEAEAERRLVKLQPEPAPEAQLPLAVLAPSPSALELEAQRQAKAEADAFVAETEAKLKAKGKKWPRVSEPTKKLLDKLENNPLFQARAPNPTRQEAVLAALEYLLELQDRAPGDAFAAHMGSNLKTRVAGIVTDLSQVLNVDGYDVLRYEPAAKQVVVERELLVQCFGL